MIIIYRDITKLLYMVVLFLFGVGVWAYVRSMQPGISPESMNSKLMKVLERGGVDRGSFVSQSVKDVKLEKETWKEYDKVFYVPAIGKEKNGTFSLDGELSHDLNTVRVHPTPTGKVYIIVFERWIKMFEVLYDTRSEDYPFTYIKLFVEEKGIGGTLFPAARIRFNKNKVIETDNFGTYPAQLMGVQLRK